MKTLLVFRTLVALVWYDLVVSVGGFQGLNNAISKLPVRGRKPPESIESEVRRAVDLSCALYPKRALCLQRSAVTVALLRRYGVPAGLVIGAQRLPFNAHAWVEIEGRVANDRPEVQETYGVLMRS